jgi:hypothetical protein
LIATTEGLTRAATSAILGNDAIDPFDIVIRVGVIEIAAVVRDAIAVEDVVDLGAVVRYWHPDIVVKDKINNIETTGKSALFIFILNSSSLYCN